MKQAKISGSRIPHSEKSNSILMKTKTKMGIVPNMYYGMVGNTSLLAGYFESHLLGIITGIAEKTMSNYSNQITQTDMDAVFVGRIWGKPCNCATNKLCNHES